MEVVGGGKNRRARSPAWGCSPGRSRRRLTVCGAGRKDEMGLAAGAGTCVSAQPPLAIGGQGCGTGRGAGCPISHHRCRGSGSIAGCLRRTERRWWVFLTWWEMMRKTEASAHAVPRFFWDKPGFLILGILILSLSKLWLDTFIQPLKFLWTKTLGGKDLILHWTRLMGGKAIKHWDIRSQTIRGKEKSAQDVEKHNWISQSSGCRNSSISRCCTNYRRLWSDMGRKCLS